MEVPSDELIRLHYRLKQCCFYVYKDLADQYKLKTGGTVGSASIYRALIAQQRAMSATKQTIKKLQKENKP